MMRNAMRDIAPYLSIFGLIVLIGALFMRPLQELPPWALPTLSIVGLILLVAWPLLRPEDLRTAMGARQTQFGGNALLLVIAAIGILAVINYLGTLRYVRWDVTEGNRLSISSQTNQILDDIADTGQEIRLTALIPSGSPDRADVETRLEQYEQRAPNIDFEIVDPVADFQQVVAVQQRTGQAPPQRGLVAEVGDVTVDRATGEVQAEPDYRSEVVYTLDEQAITEALVKVTRAEERTIAFVSGHGEIPTDAGAEGQSLSLMAGQLERLGYAVESLALSAVTDTITADAVVIAGPQQPLTDDEQETLRDYISDGGGVLLMPVARSEADFTELLAPYGVQVRDDVALDPGRPAAGVLNYPLIQGDGYQFHEITRDLEQDNLQVVFLNAPSIQTGDALTEETTISPLAQTSDRAWGETDLAEEEPIRDEGEATGPLTLAVAVDTGGSAGDGAADDDGTDGQRPGRLVVISGAEMVTDRVLNQLNGTNVVLATNAVNWLTQDEALIGIPPSEPDERPLEPPQRPWLLLISTILLMPAVVAGLGIWTIMSRR